MTTRPRQWRRLAIRLAACAAIGAAVTVGVAWGIANRGAVPQLDPDSILDSRWPQDAPQGWSGDVGTMQGRSLCWRVEEWFAYRPIPTDPVYRFTRFSCGFPAKSMRLTSWMSSAPPSALVWNFGPHLVPPSWLAIGDGVFPLTVAWRGFALDAAFFGAIVFVLWTAPGPIRRRLRQARGHCPACGYNLKGAPTPTCPECGA
jgi:hypothetical protein